jgi:hypothetical protein
MRDIYDILRDKAIALISKHQLESGEVLVQAKALSSEDAIGNPEDKDYPIISGRERIIQAEFMGSSGQAFTDMFGSYSGKLIDIFNMELTNNFRRAIFISSLNALMRHLGMADKTIHCKDNAPRECSLKLVEYISKKYGSPKIAMIGLQPRMVEALSRNFEIKVTDMDEANTGTEKFGVIIQPPQKATEHLDWCDVALVTGSTIANNTINNFLGRKPTVFYGITISGAASMLGLETFCYLGQ